MFIQVIGRSLLGSARVTACSLATLTASAALATVFFSVSLDVREKMSHSLRSLGANAVAHAAGRGSAAEWDAARGEMAGPGVESVVMHLRIGTLDGAPVGVVAADASRLERMTPYWAIAGRRAKEPGECVIGRRLAEVTKAAIGAVLDVQLPGSGVSERCRLTGLVDSGDEDESRVFITSQPQAGSADSISYALLSVAGGEAGIARLGDVLRAKGIALAPLRQVVHGEQTVLDKINLLAELALLAVIVLSCLGVTAASLSRVMERRTELALMQALGAKRRSVAALLLAEGALSGVAAALLGFIIGSALSYAVVLRIFHATLTLRFAPFAAALVVTALMSVMAAALGARQALRMETAGLLKGD